MAAWKSTCKTWVWCSVCVVSAVCVMCVVCAVCVVCVVCVVFVWSMRRPALKAGSWVVSLDIRLSGMGWLLGESTVNWFQIIPLLSREHRQCLV